MDDDKVITNPARDEKGLWLKGCASPNPGGRKPGLKKKIQAYCEKYGVDPIEYMVQVIADVKAATKDRITCAKEVADRLYGKPIQYTENTNVEVNDKEIRIEFVKPKKDN